ncbi:MAG: hypothetical protein NTV29_12540 [Planctomycetota bacterium]|jgi:uncharacterized protein YukE|nr:hypothetical protein [Planctomycetota bacterium]
MGTRSRNDLVGAKGRVQNALNHWRESRASVSEQWKDSTAEKFMTDHFAETEGKLQRILITLQEAADLVRAIEKKVADHDYGD